MLWTLLANIVVSLAGGMRLQRRILLNPGQLGDVAGQLAAFDLAVLVSLSQRKAIEITSYKA